jgi:hypothetical protein
VIALAAAAGAPISDARPAAAAQPSAAAPDSKVIVILRDHLDSAPPERGGMAKRTEAIRNAQADLIAGLQQARQREVRSFSLINAFATSLSAAEQAKLAADPRVQAVVPDRAIRAPRSWRDPERAGAAGHAGTAEPKATPTAKVCNKLEPQALQLTNAAFADPTVPQAQNVIDGKGVPVRGKGVKVAFLADGLDTTVAGFTRPNGQPVFVDYQDFSGDPSTEATAGGEAFGDASSIAAQDKPNGTLLNFDISQFVNEAHPLPSPCNIHIRGIAPGASLVGLKIFSNLGYTTTSGFVQAIDYAVTTDDVDVINESFGGNPYPDNANDPITLADEAAVAAGVTVVVSTGDAGTAGTLGSPSTSSAVIAAGASTQFRFYQQTSYFVAPGTTGFVSDNISALSSSGFAQLAPRTVDVVAPGDLSWALCSTNSTLFNDCTNWKNTPVGTPIESFGGTSEAAPLVSGEAALVIQAYRSTHGGANPTPAQVKKIIMSTATDLGARPDEQGAGLINALAAVQEALSVHDKNGSPAAQGAGLLVSPAATFTDDPDTPEKLKFTVTNTGSTARVLNPVLQTLSKRVAGGKFSLTLDPTSNPTFVGPFGENRAYVEQKFTVPAGAQHLDAAVAWPSSSALVRIVLLDPSGREAAYSLPQGSNQSYGHVDVVHPAAGDWTAVVFTAASGSGYSGPVELSWTAERYNAFGTVSPPLISLEPGQSAAVVAKFAMPTDPGDVGAALRFLPAAGDTGAANPEIPVGLRTLVPLTATGGTFSGTLTGGNGRPDAGPTQTFAFDVPAGQNNISLFFDVPDSGYVLEGLLIDPNGMQLSVQPNVDAFDDLQNGLSLSHYNPQPGRWRFVLLQNFYSSGNQTSVPFSARVGLNAAYASAPTLPNGTSATVSAATGLTVPITIVNTGNVSAAFFADARLQTAASASLPSGCGATTVTVPGGYGCFAVPPETTSVQFSASSTAPIQMDANNSAGYVYGFTGSPDIWAVSSGTNTITASLSAPEVPYSYWYTTPALIGPYPAAGATSASVSLSATGTYQPFDPNASADSGNAWEDIILGTATYSPVILAPGMEGTINVTLAPTTAQIGQTISGYIYIDTYNSTVGTGDEVLQLPYSYTVTN